MQRSSLVTQVGPVLFGHSAIPVRWGMLNGVVSMFRDQFNWQWVREASGDGWRAVFLSCQPGDLIILQLTEEKGVLKDPQTLPGVHIGLDVFDAQQAADALIDWLYYAGVGEGVATEKWGKGKIGVKIPAFGITVELVSIMPNVEISVEKAVAVPA